MSQTARLLASAAALAFFASTAMAADYDPPIYIEEVPEMVPVEIGSGWYLRGDVSYNFEDPLYDFEPFGIDTKHRRFGAGGGVGYHFSDNFRADVNIAYLGGDSVSFDDGIDAFDASHNVWSGLVNGYFDIATIMGLTPYVGAGAGVTYSRHEIDVDAPSFGVAGSFADRQYNFAYALMAGASYKISDNASVDLGYQFLHTPNMEYLNTDTGTIDEGVKQHLFKVGLRYDLW